MLMQRVRFFSPTPLFSRLPLPIARVSIHVSEILAANAPLYGRATAILRLRPLPYGALSQIYPDWPRDARVAAYAVCGGVPAYLSLLRQGNTFEDGLTGYALTAGSIIFAILTSAQVGRALPPKPDASVKHIGEQLMTQYVLPLEVIALLLTVAMIGAVIIAMKEIESKK